MKFPSFIVKAFARRIQKQLLRDNMNGIAVQKKIFHSLMASYSQTQLGKHFQISASINYNEFKQKLALQDYETLKPWIDKSIKGEENVLWPGKPLYWSKTSGTTSGIKYIPISKESISFHINAARNALLMYIAESGNYDFLNGKLIFLSGSPKLDDKNGIPCGRLSGIVNHHVPAYLRSNQLPTFPINCIEDWEQKVSAIVDETIHQDMRLISGIPPWVQMYFDQLIAKSNKSISEIFPNFSVFVYGGVNFEPYRHRIEKSIGKKIAFIETYPASEGFIAFQDSQERNDLLLLTNNGMFYEFVELNEIHTENPNRISLANVELNKNYAIVLNTNAGLSAYVIGDTVRFTSLLPYRIQVTGRIKHFISAFGEHVIGEEVEKAMQITLQSHPAVITEFTVAPFICSEENKLSYHEWFIEFEKEPEDLIAFSQTLNRALCQLNIYYADLIEGGILSDLKISIIAKDGFIQYMKQQGKLGGQNKVPRLSNDRQIAEALLKITN